MRPAGLQNGTGHIALEEIIALSYFRKEELKMWQNHPRALGEHVQQNYARPIKLFRTRGQALFCSLEEDFCWSGLVRRGVEVIKIPGSHENIFMEPNAQCLARELRRCLEEAQEQPSKREADQYAA